MTKTKHIVTYIGQGKWTDSKGIVWQNKDKHEFESLDDRDDIKFMLEYGHMDTASISISNDEDKENKVKEPQPIKDENKGQEIKEDKKEESEDIKKADVKIEPVKKAVTNTAKSDTKIEIK